MKFEIILEQIRTILNISKDLIQLALRDKLFEAKNCIKFLIRREYFDRSKEIYIKGSEKDGNKFLNNIIIDLSIKYNLSESTIKRYIK